MSIKEKCFVIYKHSAVVKEVTFGEPADKTKGTRTVVH